MINVPYVEKYRPTDMKDMYFTKYNSKIYDHIFKTNNFPNILLYGPPGTGKTTTIVNLINKYLQKNNINNKGLVLHYNASDERGIDLIRGNISNFIGSKGILSDSIKFVILDEVDYMTKVAQKYLKNIIEENYKSVRFCLICNYICKIDKSLLCQFIVIRYIQLQNNNIKNIIKMIKHNEKLDISNKEIEDISNYFKSDIRSILNYLQHKNYKIFNESIYNTCLDKFRNDSIDKINEYIYEISTKLNISELELLKLLLTSYIIKNIKDVSIIEFAEQVFNYDIDSKYILYYFYYHYNNILNI